MPYSLSNATPFRLHYRNLLLALTFFIGCDVGSVLNFEPCQFVSGIGFVVQPVLLSIWASVGRGPALLRWLVAILLCTIAWVMKVQAFEVSDTAALSFGVFMVDHLLIFPAALAIGEMKWASASYDDIASGSRTGWQFSLLNLLAATTLLAMIIAALRAFSPITLRELQDELHDLGRGDYLFWILAVLFGIAMQAVVLMPIVWAIWRVESRIWSKRWDGTFGITLLVLWVAAALVLGCEGLGLALLSPFEIVVVGPALILVRDDLRDVELHS